MCLSSSTAGAQFSLNVVNNVGDCLAAGPPDPPPPPTPCPKGPDRLLFSTRGSRWRCPGNEKLGKAGNHWTRGGQGTERDRRWRPREALGLLSGALPSSPPARPPACLSDSGHPRKKDPTLSEQVSTRPTGRPQVFLASCLQRVGLSGPRKKQLLKI